MPGTFAVFMGRRNHHLLPLLQHPTRPVRRRTTRCPRRDLRPIDRTRRHGRSSQGPPGLRPAPAPETAPRLGPATSAHGPGFRPQAAGRRWQRQSGVPFLALRPPARGARGGATAGATRRCAAALAARCRRPPTVPILPRSASRTKRTVAVGCTTRTAPRAGGRPSATRGQVGGSPVTTAARRSGGGMEAAGGWRPIVIHFLNNSQHCNLSQQGFLGFGQLGQHLLVRRRRWGRVKNGRQRGRNHAL
mmetsp:Transcript_90143/g.206120  ORF Transcript_90143/g.206120 Transcript_90143/m.206120 type:complete len:247 (+) Transcript_90143:1403-2143(+)